MQKYILKRKKYTYIGKISRNITSSPVCLLKNLELDHLCVLHNETLQAATESFLHRYKMRNSESYRTLHFLMEWLTCIYHKGFFHWDTREIRSARWLQLCTPRHYADCCTQLGVFHKTAESTFKNQQHDNDWNWAALFSDRQKETTNHHLEMFLYILSILCSESPKREGETQRLSK